MLTESSCWRVAGLLREVPNERFAGGLSDALAHAVEHLSSCDPVQRSRSTVSSKYPTRRRKHGLVERGQQGSEDDHASRRDDICNGPAEALAGIAQELGKGLKVSYLHACPETDVNGSVSVGVCSVRLQDVNNGPTASPAGIA